MEFFSNRLKDYKLRNDQTNLYPNWSLLHIPKMLLPSNSLHIEKSSLVLASSNLVN